MRGAQTRQERSGRPPKHHLDRPGALTAPWRRKIGADSSPAPGPNRARRRARLQRCHPSWRGGSFYSATDLETASLKARHAQAHPLLRGNPVGVPADQSAGTRPVPAVLQALASDGRLHTVASLRSRPGDSGIIRVATRENGLCG